MNDPNVTPSAPRRRGRGCLTIIGAATITIVVIAIIAALAGGGDDDATTGATSPGATSRRQLDEVTVTKCGPPDVIGVVYAEGTAENTSSKRSDYLIEVTVTARDGTQVGSGTGVATNVEPGQKAVWKAITDTAAERWSEGARCKVVDVERNAST
jgi:hypothetical protein